jgi:hypothetical protein
MDSLDGSEGEGEKGRSRFAQRLSLGDTTGFNGKWDQQQRGRQFIADTVFREGLAARPTG